MLHRIAVQAIIPIIITVTGFVVLGCLLLHTLIKKDMVTQTIRHETALADTLLKSVRHAMFKDDRQALQQVIEDIGSQPEVEHVRIFNKQGVTMFSMDTGEIHQDVDMSEGGCNGCHKESQPATHLGPMERARRFTNSEGREVLAITAPVYSEPECSTAACHPDNAPGSILGTLDIGFSTAQLTSALTHLRWRMIVYCLMTLVLTIAGAYSILYQRVLLPIKRLARYAEELREGNMDLAPPGGSREIATIAQILKQQAREKPISRP